MSVRPGVRAVALGSPAARVGCADEMGVFGAGELGRDEVADGLKCRSPDRERVALRFDDELIPPELRELIGTARNERLRREHSRRLHRRVRIVSPAPRPPIGWPVRRRAASGPPRAEFESVLDLPLLGEQLDLFGSGHFVAAALVGFHLRQTCLHRGECLKLLERDRDGLGLRGRRRRRCRGRSRGYRRGDAGARESVGFSADMGSSCQFSVGCCRSVEGPQRGVTTDSRVYSDH